MIVLNVRKNAPSKFGSNRIYGISLEEIVLGKIIPQGTELEVEQGNDVFCNGRRENSRLGGALDGSMDSVDNLSVVRYYS